MQKAIAFKCKTPGCEAWFRIRDLPQDTPRRVHIVLRLEEPPKWLLCPDCKQSHEYRPANKREIQTA
jgi:hypothetical protein